MKRPNWIQKRPDIAQKKAKNNFRYALSSFFCMVIRCFRRTIQKISATVVKRKNQIAEQKLSDIHLYPPNDSPKSAITNQESSSTRSMALLFNRYPSFYIKYPVRAEILIGLKAISVYYFILRRNLYKLIRVYFLLPLVPDHLLRIQLVALLINDNHIIHCLPPMLLLIVNCIVRG